MNCNISINGDIGSGKSSVCKVLSEEYGYEHVYIGELFRKIAEERGVSVTELHDIARVDPSIDKRLDDLQTELDDSRTDIVFDARLAWYFAPKSFSVYITVRPEIAAERIFKSQDRIAEKYSKVEEVFDEIVKRREIEVNRYYEKYGVRFDDLSKYNLIVDSSDKSPESVANIIIGAIMSQSQNEVLNIFG